MILKISLRKAVRRYGTDSFSLGDGGNIIYVNPEKNIELPCDEKYANIFT